jgi:hypothetical protein
MSLNAIVASGVPADDQGTIEAFFSWSPCEECGKSLGGDRYSITYRETLDGDILEANVCEECYVALCS